MTYLSDTQIAADIAPGRGGNKARLVARCYVALMNDGKAANCTRAYAEFRKENIKKTFLKLHEQFDHVLPVQYRY